MLPLCSQLHLAAAATTRLLKRQHAPKIALLAQRTVQTRKDAAKRRQNALALAKTAKDVTAQL